MEDGRRMKRNRERSGNEEMKKKRNRRVEEEKWDKVEVGQ